MIDAISDLAAPNNSLGRPNIDQPIGESFTDFLGSAAQSAMNNIQSAENISATGLMGQVGVRQVAESIMEAERAIQTAVAIREKVVSAWLDVSRMAI